MVRKLKQPSTFRLWQMYESDRHRGNAGKNEPFGVMGTFVVRLAMPVKGEMRRFIHEAEDLVVFAPDLYKIFLRLELQVKDEEEKPIRTARTGRK